jgi:hypothetical protein
LVFAIKKMTFNFISSLKKIYNVWPDFYFGERSFTEIQPMKISLYAHICAFLMHKDFFSNY